MPEKTVVLPKHSKLMADLSAMATTLGTIGSQRKKLKASPSVGSTIAGFPRLVAWFKDHQAEYERFAAEMQAAGKPKSAKAAG